MVLANYKNNNKSDVYVVRPTIKKPKSQVKSCSDGQIVKGWSMVIQYIKKYVFLCGSVVEHCVSSAKGCGFDSQGTHVLMKMYNLNAIVSRFG